MVVFSLTEKFTSLVFFKVFCNGRLKLSDCSLKVLRIVRLSSTRVHRLWNTHNWVRMIKRPYRKTPNKHPWAFASLTDFKWTFPPFSSFLRNENRTIFGWDIAKNVRKIPAWGSWLMGGAFIGRGRLLGVLRYTLKTLRKKCKKGNSHGYEKWNGDFGQRSLPLCHSGLTIS